MRYTIVATTIGAIAFIVGGTVSAAAADLPSLQPPPQAQIQPPPPDYYANPPPAQPYLPPPPVAYGYPPPPPPPVVYYEYAPPPVVVAPRPYYFGHRYVYEDHPYELRSYAPYVARGYERYDHRWDRGYRSW